MFEKGLLLGHGAKSNKVREKSWLHSVLILTPSSETQINKTKNKDQKDTLWFSVLLSEFMT